MVKKNTEETPSEVPEVDEPMSADEWIANLLQDLVLKIPPTESANDFINHFVLQNRVETPQFLAMLDAPTESVIETVKVIIEQSYLAQLQAVDERGQSFLEGLRTAVKSQMTELANSN
jgi:hypothetical protein